MKNWVLGLCALLLFGCVGEDAVVSMLDPHYEAEILGTEKDGFTAPDGLLWSNGALLMADEGGSAVRLWRPGGPVRTLAGKSAGLVSPEDLARDSAGNLYVSDDSASGVVIGKDGSIVRLAVPLQSTEGIAIAPDGRILVGDPVGHRIVALSPTGPAEIVVGPRWGIGKPESMAFDRSGNLYIADYAEHVLWLRTTDGRLHRPLGQRELSPESIAFADGKLFITDSRAGALYRYTPEDGLNAIAVLAGELANVQGITADPAGNLYVSVQTDLDAGRGYILRFRRR